MAQRPSLLDTEGPSWALILSDKLVTLRSTEERRGRGRGSEQVPFLAVSGSQPRWSTGGAGGILRPDPLYKAIVISASRESSAEAQGALLME